jgi:hypothetical protein
MGGSPMLGLKKPLEEHGRAAHATAKNRFGNRFLGRISFRVSLRNR